MAPLFAITLFASAFLLFWVQPLVAKMLLPFLGGSPTVWNVAMCFFQAALLGGYAWAHWLTNHASMRVQLAVHAASLVLALGTLPFSTPVAAVETLAQGADPFGWLLLRLALLCGLPFLLLSANGPLLQRWFARSGHPRAADPYFLFAASNAGSLLALAAFPVVLEPVLRVEQQAWWWAAGYVGMIALIVICGAGAAGARPGGFPDRADAASSRLVFNGSTVVTVRRRLKWVALAFLPSSLMLGVTQYLTTDVATVPLLWVIPLALYLGTFIVAFGPWKWATHDRVARSLPILGTGVLFTVLTSVNDPIWALFPLHLLFLFVTGLVCHGRLAADRPPVGSLTEFYFWLSLGGVLGGVFNGLVAPWVFNSVAEYPLGIVLTACLAPVRVKGPPKPWQRALGVAAAPALVLLTWLLMGVSRRQPADAVQWANWLAFGVPCVAAFLLVDRPRVFAAGLAAILAASWAGPEARGRTLARERNFFGVSRVSLSADGAFRELHHGSTIHGRQFVAPQRHHIALSYYSRGGPLAQIVSEFERRDTSRRVAVIGLGAGAMATYGRAGQEWTFYEIDPAVIRFARDTNCFTYLARCQADRLEIVEGDARLRLREAPPGHYGLIVLDAFNSDSVPVHLLTQAAVRLYLSKLAPNGVLGFHVSNRNLDIKSVVADAAAAAGLYCIGRNEDELGDNEVVYGKDASQWVMAAREPGRMPSFVRADFWAELNGAAGRAWSDDHSSVWRVIRW